MRVPFLPVELAAQAKGEPIVACVTGATGYVAAALVQRLLALGCVTVRATVRSPAKAAALRALPGAAERLQLFEADLLEEGSFDEAVRGCRYVFHVASPFIVSVARRDVERKLLRPAVAGVEHLLAAVEKEPAVEAVVLTSSVAAVHGRNDEHGGRPMTEADWDGTASADFLPYSYSKTIAEKRAWELHDARRGAWRLATVNPAFVLGPPLALSNAESLQFARMVAAGAFALVAPQMGLGVVDVDDVAALHVAAALTPDARGRYLAVAESHRMDAFLAAVAARRLAAGKRRTRIAGWPMPGWLAWLTTKVGVFPADTFAATWGRVPVYNTSRAAALGVKFLPAAQSLDEMIDAMDALAAKGKE